MPKQAYLLVAVAAALNAAVAFVIVTAWHPMSFWQGKRTMADLRFMAQRIASWPPTRTPIPDRHQKAESRRGYLLYLATSDLNAGIAARSASFP